MRVVCISDTHGWHHRVTVPEGDLLLVAGDICSRGQLPEVEEFDRWLATLPHRHKVVIAGNHDWCFEREPAEARRRITQAHYLQDQEIELEGWRIYGSPWQPRFFDWAFNLPRGAPLRAKWDLIPPGVDIVMTHGPPAGILDRESRGHSTGCVDLEARIRVLQPRLHVFGHIHEAYGLLELGPTVYVNACVCDLKYRPRQPPIVVELQSKEGVLSRNPEGAGP